MKDKIKSGTFQLGERKISFKIQQNKKIKYYGLSFLPDYSLVIQVPDFIPETEIDNIFWRHRRWICNRLEKAGLLQDDRKKFMFKDGVTLQAHERKYTLSLKINPNQKMYWQQNGNVLEISLTKASQNRISQIVIQWYKILAGEFLEVRLPIWARKMNVEFNHFRVKDQKSLWGSCSNKRNLNFNWRIMLLTPEESDYLIVHELSHLLQSNHSRKFWNVVETYLPNYKDLKQKLKEKNHLLRFP